MEVENVRDVSSKLLCLIQQMHNLSDDKNKIQEILKSVMELKQVLISSPTESNKFEEEYQSFENIIQQENMDLDIIKQNFSALLSAVLSILGKQNCNLLMINIYINIIIKNLENMSLSINMSQFINNCKQVLEILGHVIHWISKQWSNIQNKNTIHMCLDQINKCLPIILKSIEMKNIETGKYLSMRLMECFKTIVDVVGGHKNEEAECEFVFLMDALLEQIDGLSEDVMECRDVAVVLTTTDYIKSIIDEVLCYSMSVAHITVKKEDKDVITLCCNEILKTFNDLRVCIDKKNAKCKFLVHDLKEKVCCLEEQVNSSVLRLHLEVFSDLHQYLQQLIKLCRTSTTRNPDEMQTIIEQFDGQMDRIMQIGLFAVSASFDKKRKIGIKSCLASLESLEFELIPTITNLFINPKSGNKIKVQILSNHWLAETSHLKRLIDEIVDPAAFAKIVEERIFDLVGTFKDVIETSESRDVFDMILKRCRKFYQTIIINLDDPKLVQSRQISANVHKLQRTVEVCEKYKNAIEDYKLIIIEEINIITKTIRKLKIYLEEEMEIRDETIKLEFPESVHDLTLDIEDTLPQINQPQPRDFCKLLCVTPPKDTVLSADVNAALTPYSDRAMERNKQRTIMYTTPKSSKATTPNPLLTILKKTPARSIPKSSLRRRAFINRINEKIEETLCLSTILDNLTALSNTFNTVCYVETPTQDSSGTKECKSSGSLQERMSATLNELSINSSISCPSGSQYDTLDREMDLKLVEEKINILFKKEEFF